jgi:hypothetical protein
LIYWHKARHRLAARLSKALHAQTLTLARAFVSAKLLAEEVCILPLQRSCCVAQSGKAKHHALIARQPLKWVC